MQARDSKWQESYRRVIRVLPTLTKRELDIIGDVVDEFTKNITTDIDAGIKPLTEEELFSRIAISVSQADRGEYRDAEEFEAEFDAELKAAYGI